ncbi:Type I restriction-modification system specificity subunit [gamma proteobacterium HdN1]|nr:Type I restriction-modification system specificity subunit [gamma proteobacterium HdN1]
MSWPKLPLDQLGYVSRGRSRHRPRNDPSLYGGSYPFIQTGDVKHANFRISDHTATYSEAGLAQSRLWPKDTLCITIAANIADTALLGYEACFPDSIIGFIADEEKADPRFVKYYFDIIQRELQMVSQGATQDNLSQEKLLSFGIACPPVEVQRKVAEVLSAYDDLIATNQRRIALLEDAARRLYREWFVHLRFPGHESVAVKDGVPEGWCKRSMTSVADFVNGFAFKPEHLGEAGLPVVKIPELRSGITSKTPYNLGHIVPQRNHITTGDVLFSWSATLLVNEWGEGPALLNQHLFKVIPRNELHKRLVRFAVEAAIPELIGHAVGATMQHIRRSALDNHLMLVPDDTTSVAFAAQADPMMDAVLNLTAQNRELTKARDLLLPKLMSGQLDVSNIRLPEEATA